LNIYKVREVAEILRVSKDTVYSLIKNGFIVPLKLNGLKIPDYELERFVKENQGLEITLTGVDDH
jgi:excisionase family DNA binding protein